MKNKLNLVLVVFLGSITLFSCKKERINGGSIVIEDREVDMTFEKIVLDASFDVYLVDTDDYNVRVECPERKMEYIKTTVVGNQLIIRENHNAVITNKDKKIYIAKNYLTDIEIRKSGCLEGNLTLVPEMNIEIEGSGDLDLSFDSEGDVDVLIHGSGDVDLNFVSQGNFEADIDGSGDVTVTGEAEAFIGTINGSGTIDAKDMEVIDADIFVDGSGDTFVKAITSLHVQINGSGDVYYLGSPALDISDNGSGDVIQY